jgi:hypothetical protein
MGPNAAAERRVEIPSARHFGPQRQSCIDIQKIIWFDSMADRKPVEFRGSSLDDLRAFPVPTRREAGHQIDQVQQGREPDDWKPMPRVGSEVQEIRIRDAEKRYRDLTKGLAP